MKRIFIGIPLSDELRELAWSWQKAHSGFPVKWLKGKNLHVTVVPPWAAQDEALDVSRLQTVREFARPFVLEFNRVTFGPNSSQPRLIWATGPNSAPLSGLRQNLLRVLPVPAPLHPLRPHVTLARFRPAEFSSFPARILDEAVSWRMPVESFVLYESRLLSAGADYEPLAEFKL